MTAPTARFDFTAPVPALELLGRVHLIAIGGAGMSAVARLLLARGLPVSGSDAADSPTLESLRDSGARVHLGHDPAHVADVDTVVVSSAIRDDNVELAAARARGPACAAPVPGPRVAHGPVRAGWPSPAPTARPRPRRCSSSRSSPPGPTPRSPRAARSPSSAPTPPSVTGRPSSSRPTRATAPSSPTARTSPSSRTCSPTTSTSTARARPSRTAYAAFVESVTDGGLLVACHDDDGSRRLADAARAAGRTVRHLRLRRGRRPAGRHGELARPRHPVRVRARRGRARARPRGAG